MLNVYFFLETEYFDTVGFVSTTRSEIFFHHFTEFFQTLKSVSGLKKKKEVSYLIGTLKVRQYGNVAAQLK